MNHEFPKLTFFNHACFAVETSNTVLLMDPWVEGSAFNTGWQLLDSTLSNTQLVDWLKVLGHKEVLIYFSHEHSDHFSTSFIREVAKVGLQLKFVYPKTADGRVKAYLTNLGQPVIDLIDGVSLNVKNEIEVTNWKFYSGGDSYVLIKANNVSILNLNDCDVRTDEQIRVISGNLKKVGVSNMDVLFTQFGYANWIGNKEEKFKRYEAADAAMKRVSKLSQYWAPKLLVPFASFAYFCDEENFYVNSEQVSPLSFYEYAKENKFSETIRFMKPWDEMIPADLLGKGDRVNANRVAIDHWSFRIAEAKPNSYTNLKVAPEVIMEAARAYIQSTNQRILQIPRLFSVLKLSKPIQILITDLNLILECSYASGAKWSLNGAYTISCNSKTVEYLFKQPFGFNTLSVNAKFQVSDSTESINLFRDFFVFQELLKNGLDSRGRVHLIISVVKMGISKIVRAKF
jgi:UDP-MurNAc hydroxylase